MTVLDLYEDALPALQDHLPDWWAKEFRVDPVANLVGTNWVTNPCARNNLAGFTQSSGSTVTRETDLSTNAPGCPLGTPTGVKDVTTTSSGRAIWQKAVTSGELLAFSVYVYVSALTATSVIARVRNAANTAKGASAAVTSAGGGWQRLTVIVVADATETWNFTVEQSGAGGATFYATGWQIETAASVSGYFDGASSDVTRWAGTPDASVSELYDRSLTTRPQSNLYALLKGLAGPVDELSAGLEALFADMALMTATLDGLRREYAYAYGIDYEQLPPTVDALRQYLQAWIGATGSKESLIAVLVKFLKTPVNTTGTELVFPADGSGLTFPADGSGLVMFQKTTDTAYLAFPADGSGLTFPADGSGLIFPVTGWVDVAVDYQAFTWTVTTKSYLNFDRAAFARAVERLRQAHLLPAAIVELNT